MYTLSRTKPIPVRLDLKLYNFIRDYALLVDISNSEALREILKAGIIKKGHIGTLKRWEEKIKYRNPMLTLDTCDKCANHDNLMIYHIDGNVRNLKPENLAILCQNCVKKLNCFIRKYDPKDKFAAWFFYET